MTCGDASGKSRVESWLSISPQAAEAATPEFRHPRHGLPSQHWTYRDAQGCLLGFVVRFDPLGRRKQFCPLSFGELDGKRGWHWKALPTPRPIYGLDRLAARPDAPVIVTEGEKAADAAQRIFPDHVAVTSSGGARSAATGDWTPLAGRNVWVWPDRDSDGWGYARAVAKLATEAGAANVATVAIPDRFSPQVGFG